MTQANKQPAITTVGSRERLNQVLAGDYQLSVGAALKSALQITVKSLNPLLPAAMVLFAISMVIVLVAETQFGPLLTEEQEYTDTFFYLTWTLKIILAPLFGGLVWMGLKLASGQKAKVGDLFAAMPRAVPLMLFIAITSTISLALGSILQGLPMVAIVLDLLISVLLIATIPLLLLFPISVLNALYYSVLIVKHQFLKFLLLYVVVLIGIGFGLVTLGAGFLFIGPFIFVLYGVVYSHLFGLMKLEPRSNQDNENTRKNKNDDDWSA